MRPGRIVATGALAAVLAFAPSVLAGSTTEIREGDVVAVAGTAILCVAVTSNSLLGIGCYKTQADGDPRPLSFTVGLARNGTVAMSRVRRNGTAQRIFRRELAGGGRTYTAEVDDRFTLAGTDLGCNVARIGTAAPRLFRGVRILCYLLDGDGLAPDTNGISISNRFAGIFRIDAEGSPSVNVIVREHRA